ncbi:MAG: tRNA (adenosine(37)-N6)-dimethylallyltransferase MiaA [Acidimicrobiia bacterium]
MLGPTASGKSEVALALAERLEAEILSVDSMQVYRGMDIGTAKPGPPDRSRVPHHMIDVADPEDEYTVAEFQRDAREALAASRRPVIVVGGSGLHFRAVVDPLEFPPHDPSIRRHLDHLEPAEAKARLLAADPGAGALVDVDNPRRVARALEVLELTGRRPSQRSNDPARRRVASYEPEIPFQAIGLDPGPALAERASLRLDAMRRAGLLEEVASLAGRLGRTASQAVGYRQLLPVVAGELDPDAGFRGAARATIRLARRQRTFFRRDPRIRWLAWDDDPSILVERAGAALEAA